MFFDIGLRWVPLMAKLECIGCRAGKDLASKACGSELLARKAVLPKISPQPLWCFQPDYYLAAIRRH